MHAISITGTDHEPTYGGSMRTEIYWITGLPYGEDKMKRTEQLVLIGTFLGCCWLSMQAVHELGHVLAAWLSGGEVVKVALHPAIISRTDLGGDPHPLFVVWAGAIVGALLPLTVFMLARICRFAGVYMFRFWAGFCLIANGVYVACGPDQGGADSAVMMAYGSPRLLLLGFGLVTVPLGLYLWHRQGNYFGLGEANGKVDRQATLVAILLFIAIVGLELLIDSR